MTVNGASAHGCGLLHWRVFSTFAYKINHIMLKTSITKAVISLMFLILSVPASHGVPAKPGAIKVTTSTGEVVEIYKHGDEHFHYITDKDGNVLVMDASGDLYFAVNSAGAPVSSGVRYSAANKAKAMLHASDMVPPSPRKTAVSRVAPEAVELPFKSEGELRTVIILVEYQDVKFSVGDIKGEIDRLLNETDYSRGGATGSAKDYFEYSSNGKFSPKFDVYGPVTLSQNRAYYGGNDRYGNDLHPAEMVSEGVKLLDDVIDFSTYDLDGNGEVDNVYVIYAGCGESDTDIEESVWPHAHRLEYAGIACYLDGVRVNSYACSSELEGESRKLAGIGTLCHEFSHVLGLPDLYQTGSLPALEGAPGYFSVMSYGTYNDDGRTPPAYTAWERYVMGWLEPKVLAESQDVAMRCIDEDGYDDCYLIHSPRDNEYWILENRQPLRWDKPLGARNLNAHGLLVWHIDYDHREWTNNSMVNNPSHPRVDIVEAAGNALNTPWQAPFPGTAKKTEWTDVVTWNKEKQPYSLTKIQEQGTLIHFCFNAGASGIDDITADDNAPVEYFNLHGEKVTNPHGAPGVYIMRQGTKTNKVMIP